ncbi:universal stress protein [Sphaerisporangium sp. TRM90804]|uniref:universal stress protein n=1 Tax=Sphaerisporangium sp. TRM90804 TaxID=3031113 RepID=UPI0024496C9B|nr:universal stress protein [Sphaerisporangium sp. TRM90804]MDH2427363.1 universal stress protein [Sphaerisporangium sp. TRM90804]
MTGRVVVGVDGSPSAAAAVAWAADDAGRRGARLRIVHVREPWTYDFPLKAAPDSEDSVPSYWHDALAAAVAWVHGNAPGVEVSAALVTGAVAERLTTEAEDADELILGSRGLGGIAGLVLGSVGRSVAGHAAAPVVVVRGPASTCHGEVVVGYDGSETADAAMEFGMREAGLRGALLRAVHAWPVPPFPPFAAAYAGGAQQALAQVSRGVRDRLLSWQERHPDVPVAARTVRGHPVSALADASRTADLVVVGSRALDSGPPVLGPVGQGVLRHARSPVAVVRPRRTPDGGPST